MLRSKKFLLSAGAIVIILSLFIFSSLRQENASDKDNKITDKTGKELTDQKQNSEVLAETQSEDAVNNTSDGADNNTITAQNQTLAMEEVIITDEVKSEIDKLITKYYDTSKKFDRDLLMTNDTKTEDQTVDEIESKREVIQEYQNLNTYVKPGPEADTYVAFTSYEMKLFNIDTKVPGMSLLYVTKNEKGNLNIYNNPLSEEQNNYFVQLTKEKDIKAVIDEVNSKLSKAVDKDSTLKGLLNLLGN